MTKTELIKTAADACGMSPADMKKALEAVLNTIEQSVKKEEPVTLIGFGTFLVKERTARKGYNPSTREVIQVAAKKAVKFKPSIRLNITSQEDKK